MRGDRLPPFFGAGGRGQPAPGKTSTPRARVFRRRASTTSFHFRSCPRPKVSGMLCWMLAPGSRSWHPSNEGCRRLSRRLTHSRGEGERCSVPSRRGVTVTRGSEGNDRDRCAKKGPYRAVPAHEDGALVQGRAIFLQIATESRSGGNRLAVDLLESSARPRGESSRASPPNWLLMESEPEPTELAEDDSVHEQCLVRTVDRESPEFADSFRSRSELGLPPRLDTPEQSLAALDRFYAQSAGTEPGR
jgi:hypothetical protein